MRDSSNKPQSSRPSYGSRFQGKSEDGVRSRRPGPGGPSGGPKRRFSRRKVCRFCVDSVKYIDFKNYRMLKEFLTERGKIMPRRITGTCANHQRMLTTAIKRARNMALLSFTHR